MTNSMTHSNVRMICRPTSALRIRTVGHKANLRDEFAMAALSLVAGDPHRPARPEMIAARAYAIADAMLEQREEC